MTTIIQADRDRFEAKVRKAGPEDCWLWLAHTNGKGRGRFWLEDRGIYASHVALILAGKPRPSGLQALHTCNNPSCVNPEHLYWGTRSDNAQDAIRDGRNRNARKTHCKHGHSLDGCIVHHLKNGRTRRNCRTCDRARKRAITAAEARAREEGTKAMHWPDQWPLGTRVRKRKGSSWQGHVVGYYSTDLTPCGYAVESEREPGSVQIYPKAALEALDPAQIVGGKP